MVIRSIDALWLVHQWKQRTIRNSNAVGNFKFVTNSMGNGSSLRFLRPFDIVIPKRAYGCAHSIPVQFAGATANAKNVSASWVVCSTS